MFHFSRPSCPSRRLRSVLKVNFHVFTFPFELYRFKYYPANRCFAKVHCFCFFFCCLIFFFLSCLMFDSKSTSKHEVAKKANSRRDGHQRLDWPNQTTPCGQFGHFSVTTMWFHRSRSGSEPEWTSFCTRWPSKMESQSRRSWKSQFAVFFAEFPTQSVEGYYGKKIVAIVAQKLKNGVGFDWCSLSSRTTPSQIGNLARWSRQLVEAIEQRWMVLARLF